MKRLMLLLAVVAAASSGATYAAVTTRTRIEIQHGQNGSLTARFLDAGTSCAYPGPGKILCWSDRHTHRGDFGVYLTPASIRVVQYEPGRFASRYTALQH